MKLICDDVSTNDGIRDEEAVRDEFMVKGKTLNLNYYCTRYKKFKEYSQS